MTEGWKMNARLIWDRCRMDGGWMTKGWMGNG